MVWIGMNTFKNISKYRICYICEENKKNLIKEELVAKAWHPSRVEKWLEAGMDIDDC